MRQQFRRLLDPDRTAALLGRRGRASKQPDRTDRPTPAEPSDPAAQSLATPGRGEIYGRAAGSLLEDNDFTSRLDPALRQHAIFGELNTSHVLEILALQPGGPTVLNNLRFPKQSIKANIDHVLVAGSRVLVIDSKRLHPGTYAGDSPKTLTRNGAPSDNIKTKTGITATNLLRGYLTDRHTQPSMDLPLLVLWPSSPGVIDHGRLRLPGVRTTTGPALYNFVICNQLFAPADPAIVNKLRQLVL